MPPPAAKRGGAKGGAAAAPPAHTGPSPADAAEARLLRLKCADLLRQKVADEAAAAGWVQEKEALVAALADTRRAVENARSRAAAAETTASDAAADAAFEARAFQGRIQQLLVAYATAGAAAVRADRVVAVRAAQEGGRTAEAELGSGVAGLKGRLVEIEAAHEEHVKALKLEHDRSATGLRADYERRLREAHGLYDDRQGRLREEMRAAREDEVKAVDVAAGKHVAALVAGNARAYGEIKGHFNEITHSNLDLIKALKEELDDLRRREANDERAMFHIATENRAMSEPLRKVLGEIKRLTAVRDEYRSDLGALAALKSETAALQSAHDELRWEHEVVTQRLEAAAAARDGLRARFADAVHEVERRAGMRRLLAERELAATDTALAAAIAAGGTNGSGSGDGGMTPPPPPPPWPAVGAARAV